LLLLNPKTIHKTIHKNKKYRLASPSVSQPKKIPIIVGVDFDGSCRFQCNLNAFNPQEVGRG
jgi:hypothetical protein